MPRKQSYLFDHFPNKKNNQSKVYTSVYLHKYIVYTSVYLHKYIVYTSVYLHKGRQSDLNI